jgi:hypothetical protein
MLFPSSSWPVSPGASALDPAVRPPLPDRPVRALPGRTVVVSPAQTLPLAGYLLRHGPALALVESVPDPVVVGSAMGGVVPLPLSRDDAEAEARRHAALDTALRATANAGFDVRAVEDVPPGGLTARLRAVAGTDVTCVVAATRSPRTVRRLARAAGAPVLALPHRAAPAGGPAVFDAADASWAAPAAARALATEHAVAVSAYAPAPAATALRRAALPVVARRVEALADERLAEELERAWSRVDAAAWTAEDHGLTTEKAVTPQPGAVPAAARAREGLVVAVDHGGRRPPALLRAALGERRPVLLVPADAPGEG